MFTYGFKEDLYSLVEYLPNSYQSIMVSATVDNEISIFKDIFLHNPVIIKLKNTNFGMEKKISDYFIWTEEIGKATIIATLLKFNLISGKILLFVSCVERCYKLNVFLEKIGIKSLIFNQSMPLSVRNKTQQEFNQSVCNIMITSFESSEKLNKKSLKHLSLYFNILDIHLETLSNIIIFDFPPRVSLYLHESGRKSKKNFAGNILSFVKIEESGLLQKVQNRLKKITGESDFTIKPFKFNVKETTSMEYRCTDIWQAITSQAIQEKIRSEIYLHQFFHKKSSDFDKNISRDLNVTKQLLHPRLASRLEPAQIPDYIASRYFKSIKFTKSTCSKKTSSFKNLKNSKKINPLKVSKIDFAKEKKL